MAQVIRDYPAEQDDARDGRATAGWHSRRGERAGWKAQEGRVNPGLTGVNAYPRYGNLGLIYRTRGELDRADEMHKNALTIDEKLGRQEGMAIAYGNLGAIYQTRGELDRAEEMLKKALVLFKAVGAAPRVKQVQASLDGLNKPA